MKRALITGITGQDGKFLTHFLHKKNYKIFGLFNNKNKVKNSNFLKEYPYVVQIKGDLCDYSSLVRAIKFAKPNEVYNLAGISLVTLSFKEPDLVQEVNGKGIVRLLEAVRIVDTENTIRVYQASSSEMFGKVKEVPQNENTLFNPVSPYGESKVFAHKACARFRSEIGMHISCGILYNHESEFRSENFVTRKISMGLAQIVKGELDYIRLGNLESRRDWGYAGDYVEAMWLMLQQKQPSDFIIATGVTHSVRDFLEKAIQAAGLSGGVEKYVQIDDNFKRIIEVGLLVGDAKKS